MAKYSLWVLTSRNRQEVETTRKKKESSNTGMNRRWRDKKWSGDRQDIETDREWRQTRKRRQIGSKDRGGGDRERQT